MSYVLGPIEPVYFVRMKINSECFQIIPTPSEGGGGQSVQQGCHLRELGGRDPLQPEKSALRLTGG